MKLEGALKLYMVGSKICFCKNITNHIYLQVISVFPSQVLYFLAFLFTFMMSVPMLKHVMPQSKCLLFVQVLYIHRDELQ